MARYHRQLTIALERLDQGLARVHSLIKRGENKQALYYMDNDLKAILTLKDIFQIEEARFIANVSSASDVNTFELINKIKRIIYAGFN